MEAPHQHEFMYICKYLLFYVNICLNSLNSLNISYLLNISTFRFIFRKSATSIAKPSGTPNIRSKLKVGWVGWGAMKWLVADFQDLRRFP